MSRLGAQSRRYECILGLLCSLALLLGLAACGQGTSTDPQRDIIGRWQSRDGTWTLEFTAQGKVHSVYESGGIREEADSDTVFLDDTHILGVWELNMQAWEVRIRGDQMTLIGGDGRRLEFRRVE